MRSSFRTQSIYICRVLYRILWPVRASSGHYSTQWPSYSFFGMSSFEILRCCFRFSQCIFSTVLAYWEEPRKYPLISFSLGKGRATALWPQWDISPFVNTGVGPRMVQGGVGEWGWAINTENVKYFQWFDGCICLWVVIIHNMKVFVVCKEFISKDKKARLKLRYR